MTDAVQAAETEAREWLKRAYNAGAVERYGWAPHDMVCAYKAGKAAGMATMSDALQTAVGALRIVWSHDAGHSLEHFEELPVVTEARAAIEQAKAVSND